MIQLKILMRTALILAATAKAEACKPFSATMHEYSVDFKQPEPPLIKPEFSTHFVQHKWDEKLSNIAAGYIVNSPSQEMVHVDVAYEGNLASSVFNYANVTKEGLVDNTVTTFSANGTDPEVWRDFVTPNFPIFAEDILVQSEAVFTGMVEKKFLSCPVASWSILYQGLIPTIVYVDKAGVLVGYDYFSPDRRTRVVTEFFNTKTTS